MKKSCRRTRNKNASPKGEERTRLFFERGFVRWGCIRLDSRYQECYTAGLDYEGISHKLLLSPERSENDLRSILSVSPSRKDEMKYQLQIFSFLSKLGGNNPSSNFLFANPIIRHKDMVSSEGIDLKLHEKYFKGLKGFAGELPRQILIGVNLNYGKIEIMRAFEEELDRWLAEREARGLSKGHRTPEYEIIKKYQKIYECRKVQGLSAKETARKLFPKAYEKESKLVVGSKENKKRDEIFGKLIKKNRDEMAAYEKAYAGAKGSNKVVQMVVDGYAAAIELIEKGGWKDIS